jgi:hypothetical protein
MNRTQFRFTPGSTAGQGSRIALDAPETRDSRHDHGYGLVVYTAVTCRRIQSVALGLLVKAVPRSEENLRPDGSTACLLISASARSQPLATGNFGKSLAVCPAGAASVVNGANAGLTWRTPHLRCRLGSVDRPGPIGAASAQQVLLHRGIRAVEEDRRKD